MRTLLMLLALLFVTPASAASKTKRLPKHFAGVGLWSYTEHGKQNPHTFAANAVRQGFTHAILKSGEGHQFGLVRAGKIFDRRTVKAFHLQGLRCYAYATGYFFKDRWVTKKITKVVKGKKVTRRVREKKIGTLSDPKKMVAHMIHTWHLGADGFVVDDLFMKGSQQQKIEAVFAGGRRHLDTCRRCKGKVLAFSTYPHMAKWHACCTKLLQHADFFLCQIYWKTLGRSPERAMIYSLAQWQELLKRCRLKDPRCKFLPVAQTYGKVSPPEIHRFFSLASRRKFPGITVFRYGAVRKKWWPTISGWARTYPRGPQPRKTKTTRTRPRALPAGKYRYGTA